jgi:ATP-binding cassette, subfamily B, bacterial
VNVISIDSLRRHMTYVPQDPAIFDTTISGNVRYGRPDATDEQVVDAVDTADLSDDVSKLPDGLETRAGQRGRRLSGGQRQKVAIARGLLRNTPIVILDEPTTGLDSASTTRIMEPLRRLIRGRTTVIITHNLMLARDADLIVVLAHGRVVDQGDHATLFQRCDLYRTLCQESGASFD